MKLTALSVHNFRGIKEGVFFFPLNQRLLCVIGPGDSCKTTLLTAIEWCLWPTWSLIATDLDFYSANTKEPIVIEATIAETPGELLTEDKFGLYLRDLGSILLGKENDEPVDGGTPVITIRLSIDDSLEPLWTVVTNRTEPKIISQKDRKLLSFGVVGFDYEKDFSWGRGSILQKYSNNSKGALHTAYTQAMRSAVEKTDLSELDQVTSDMRGIGSEYGVFFNGELHNKLIMQNGSYSTAVGIFDSNVPFFQRGLGSKRLLSMGMNIHASAGGSLILIDEIETGLEPYRISTLINQLRTEFKNQGQIIFTTHSRSVVCECSADELFVLNENQGKVSLFSMSAKETRDAVQAIIRSEPDAFLCKRLIVCEGKTEIGLLRALDDHMHSKSGSRFAHNGVGTALGGGGNKHFELAKLLRKCGYDACILMDSDIAEEEEQKREVEELGIPVFSWEQGNAIEEQLFKDATIECAEQLIALAIGNKGFDSVKTRLISEVPNAETEFQFSDETITLQNDIDVETLVCIGKVAKGKWNKKKQTYESGWFKRIDLGQQVGDLVFQEHQMVEDSFFLTLIDQLTRWIYHEA